MTGRTGLVLVGRKGCHLCDEALRLLDELGLAAEVLDVDHDERLFELYDWRVPVILHGGRVLAEGRITREQLTRALGEEAPESP